MDENEQATPKDVLEAREAARLAPQGKTQTSKGVLTQSTLEVQKVQTPQTFSRESILKTVTELIVVGAHVSLTTDLALHPF